MANFRKSASINKSDCWRETSGIFFSLAILVTTYIVSETIKQNYKLDILVLSHAWVEFDAGMPKTEGPSNFLKDKRTSIAQSTLNTGGIVDWNGLYSEKDRLQTLLDRSITASQAAYILSNQDSLAARMQIIVNLQKSISANIFLYRLIWSVGVGFAALVWVSALIFRRTKISTPSSSVKETGPYKVES
jgi:hypothetical protein